MFNYCSHNKIHMDSLHIVYCGCDMVIQLQAPLSKQLQWVWASMSTVINFISRMLQGKRQVSPSFQNSDQNFQPHHGKEC